MLKQIAEKFPTSYHSMQFRTTVLVSAVVVVFMLAAAIVLTQMFYLAIEQGVKSRLEASLYGVMAVAEPQPDGSLSMPSRLPESDFNQLNTGLYAWVKGKESILWRSNSALSVALPALASLPPGEFSWQKVFFQDQSLWLLSFGSVWQLPGQAQRQYQFFVAQNQAPFMLQLNQFKYRLIGSFLLMALLLVLAQLFLLRWGLRPLGRLSEQIRLVESGQVERISGQWVSELLPLVRNLNMLIDTEKKQRERYRHTLGDLAHSLKTPLTVLQRTFESNQPKDFSLLTEQIGRMDHIIQYHLKRSVSAQAPFQQSRTDVVPILRAILDALKKVYVEKKIHLSLAIPQALSSVWVPLEEADVYELLGNLLDNAFKYAQSQVSVQLSMLGDRRMAFAIEDDGLGICEDHYQNIFDRGVRLDEKSMQSGQGIGLAVVKDICDVYDLRLSLAGSDVLKGAKVCVEIPLT